MQFKVIYLLILLHVISASVLPAYHASLWQERRQASMSQCEVVECANKEGDTCKAEFLSEIICPGGTHCSANTSTCEKQKLKKYGETCANSDECEGACISNRCNSLYSPGTSCTHNDQCVQYYDDGTYYAASCNARQKCAGILEGRGCAASKQCVAPLVCSIGTCTQPQKLGYNCTDDSGCLQTLYCHDLECVNPIPVGGTCNVARGMCEGNAICTQNAQSDAGTCVRPFSGAVGDLCYTFRQCQEGLACYNGTCGAGFSFSASSKTPCNQSSQCVHYEECKCDAHGETKCFVRLESIPTPAGTAKLTNDIFECTKKCLRSDVICISKCAKKFCSLEEFNENRYNEILSAQGYPQCYLDASKRNRLESVGYPGIWTCEGSFVRASSIFAIVTALLLALLF